MLADAPSADEDTIGSEGVDAVVACHPIGVFVLDDLEPMTKPLSIALVSNDSLVEVSSAGKIKDILAAKKEVPHQVQVYVQLFFGHIISSFHSFLDSLVLACSRRR